MVPAYSLSPVEQRVVAAIQDHMDATGCGASLQELMATCGYASKGNIHRVINQLVGKGWVMKLPFRSRSITLVHRLSPPPIQAVRALVERLLEEVSSDGVVRAELPVRLIRDAAQALETLGVTQRAARADDPLPPRLRRA